MFRRILFVYDRSRSTAKAFDRAVRLVQLCEGELAIAAVIRSVVLAVDYHPENLFEGACAHVARQLSILQMSRRLPGPPATTFIRMGYPGREIALTRGAVASGRDRNRPERDRLDRTLALAGELGPAATPTRRHWEQGRDPKSTRAGKFSWTACRRQSQPVYSTGQEMACLLVTAGTRLMMPTTIHSQDKRGFGGTGTASGHSLTNA
jgi:nucleotide-binding universal stress UspA family protein